MKKIVIRDASGQVINIGPWDYQKQPVYGDDPDEPLKDKKGKIVGYKQKVVGETITNPMPEGATQTEEEVTDRADGGLAVATDYTSLRRGAYPSLVDQLDALWKGGPEAEAMRAQVLGVKTKYPKSTLRENNE